MLRKREYVSPVSPHNGYPTSDGKPMAETDWHRDLMLQLIETLKVRYEADPTAYVSGNLLVFYDRGNKRRHVAPDVFVVFGVRKARRPNYLVWEEGKGPDVVVELTSSSTRAEDTRTKRALYLNTLGVREYFLFDPFEDYLDPSMQGFRRVAGEFRPIRPKDRRLPSRLLGLHLERQNEWLRLWDPRTGTLLPTYDERTGAERAARLAAEAENAHLRAELDRIRRQANGPNGS